jgi:hypothetical protein
VYLEAWEYDTLTSLNEDVVWCASRETAVGFASFLRRLIFAYSTTFSKTSTTGVSPAACFLGFLFTDAKAEGGGIGMAVPFVKISSLKKLDQIKATECRNLDEATRIL